MLLTDLSADYVRSHFADATAESWAAILRLFTEMEREGGAWLDAEEIAQENRRFIRVLDARYRGQNFEVKVAADGLAGDALPAATERFQAAHTQEYGYAIPYRGVEFVSARVQAVGVVAKAPQVRIAGGASFEGAIVARRPVFFDSASGWQEATVYARERLPVEQRFHGPAVVAEMSATTLIASGQSATIDAWGNLIVEIPS